MMHEKVEKVTVTFDGRSGKQGDVVSACPLPAEGRAGLSRCFAGGDGQGTSCPSPIKPWGGPAYLLLSSVTPMAFICLIWPSGPAMNSTFIPLSISTKSVSEVGASFHSPSEEFT